MVYNERVDYERVRKGSGEQDVELRHLCDALWRSL